MRHKSSKANEFWRKKWKWNVIKSHIKDVYKDYIGISLNESLEI